MSSSTRGTRNLFGEEAKQFTNLANCLRYTAIAEGYQEYIPSAMAETALFTDKAGPEIVNQMYTFTDKGGRDLCLIPEVTALVQKEYKEGWSMELPKPVKVFYLARCYRYERPQAGRYREFWQFGVENLGGKATKQEMIDSLTMFLRVTGLSGFKVNDSVKRGLSYYVEDGFEVEVEGLGAQKQIAGGGRYDCGIGWAIGVERLLLSLQLPRSAV
jgi:histidyl-tRNA synthetase